MTEAAFKQSGKGNRAKESKAMNSGGLTEQQLEARRQGITSTDIAAIMGVHPWRSPVQVWREKKGERIEIPDNVHPKRGRFLEPAIRTWYAEEVGADRVDLPGTVVNLDNPIVIATPDGISHIRSEERALEIKAPRAGAAGEGWGAPGTDQVPAHYLLQARWHLLATDLPRCDVVALRFGELFIYEIGRNAELEGIMLEHAQRFWTDHVLGGTPPAAGALDSEWLRSLYPVDTGEVLLEQELAPEVRAAVRELLEVHGSRSKIEKRYKALAAQIQEAMGAASMIQGDSWRIDWKCNKSSPSTDWKGLALHLLETFEEQEAAGHVQAFTTTKPGARPFTPRTKGEA